MTDWVQKQMERIHREEEGQASLWGLGQKGGLGSGHHGHAGRPGRQGGSLPGMAAATAQGEREPASEVKVGDTIKVRVRMRGGKWEEKPAKVLAAHPGIALHRALPTDPNSNRRKRGYTITHINSSASVFPRRILTRGAADSAMEAVSSSGLDWSFEKIGDATEKHLDVIREWSITHREDLAW